MFKLIIIFILITVLGLLAGSHFETLTNYISEGLANFQKFITSNLTILEHTISTIQADVQEKTIAKLFSITK